MAAFPSFKAGSRIVTTEDTIMDILISSLTNVPIVKEVNATRAQRTHQELFMRGIALLFDIPQHCGDLLTQLQAGGSIDFPSVDSKSQSRTMLNDKIKQHAVHTKQVIIQNQAVGKPISPLQPDVSALCLNYMSILQYAELFKNNREPIRAIFSYLFKLHVTIEAAVAAAVLKEYTADEVNMLDAYYVHLRSRFYTADKFLLRMKHLMQIFILPGINPDSPLYLDAYLVALKEAVHFQGDTPLAK